MLSRKGSDIENSMASWSSFQGVLLILFFLKSLVEIDPIGSYQSSFIRFLLESCGVKFEHNSMSK